MILILENILSLFKRFTSVLALIFLYVGSICAQHSPSSDTIVGLSGQEDSATEIHQADSALTQTDYFNHITGRSALDTVEVREVPAHVIDSLKKEDAFWYADKVFTEKKKKEKNVKNPELPSQWMNMTTLVIIIVIFVVLLGWYLFQNNIISGKQKILDKDGEDQFQEESIFDINYQREIEKAVNSANYRLAVRLMFLRLLKDLSQENIIQYKQGRTNFDYLSQLNRGPYYDDFFRITRNYEYAWYGKFEVNQDAFRIIKKEFEKFDLKLP
jgi:hypothetical protein